MEDYTENNGIMNKFLDCFSRCDYMMTSALDELWDFA